VRRVCSTAVIPAHSAQVCAVGQYLITGRDQVEVERAHSPSLPALAPEFCLDLVEHIQQSCGRKIRLQTAPRRSRNPAPRRLGSRVCDIDG
jgi:hypothetical protein